MKYELVNQGAKQDRSERVNRGVVMKKDRIYGYRRSRGRPSFNAVVVSALLVLIGGIVTPSVHAAASVALAGDSTVASGTGWGDALLAHLSSGSTVNNQAVGGRSTKSFMDEGKWSSAVNLDRDYVFIQFGHKIEFSLEGLYELGVEGNVAEWSRQLLRRRTGESLKGDMMRRANE